MVQGSWVGDSLPVSFFLSSFSRLFFIPYDGISYRGWGVGFRPLCLDPFFLFLSLSLIFLIFFPFFELTLSSVSSYLFSPSFLLFLFFSLLVAYSSLSLFPPPEISLLFSPPTFSPLLSLHLFIHGRTKRTRYTPILHHYRS